MNRTVVGICPAFRLRSYVALGAAVALVLSVAAGCGSSTDDTQDEDTSADQVSDQATQDGKMDGISADQADGNLPDVAPDTVGPCMNGETQCADAATVATCQNGIWITSQVCSQGQICLGGQCGQEEACTPGSVKGCFSAMAMNVCDPTGKGFISFPCDPGEICVDGQCKTTACVPGKKQCVGAVAYSICLNDGSGWDVPVDCLQNETCVGGQCLDACATDPKFNQSNVGCEFWSLDLGQWEVKPGEMGLDPSASTIPHAVVVGNPNDVPVYVTFETGEGTPVGVPDPSIDPGETKAFVMPVMSIQESEISYKSIRLRTNRPVTAAQFNPPSNEDFVHTSDASLLFPPSILGKEYYAVSMPSLIGPDMPMVGKSPSVWGYFTLVAVEEGITDVTVTLPCDTEAGPDFPAYTKGQTFTVQLNQFQVLNVNSLAVGLMATNGHDLTGAHIIASQKIAVFGGHHCTTVGDSNCDHLETSLLPVEAWGTRYVAPRLKIYAPNMYKVISGADNVTITTIPPIGELNGKTLNKGEWLQASTEESFLIEGTGPIQLIQLIEGNSEGGGTMIDPSMTMVVPNYQFRNDYPILVPAAYEKNFVALVKAPDTDIELNGVPLQASFLPIPGGEWEVGNIEVSEGLNRLVGDGPFGLISYGYASKVSYAYPGGLNGKVGEE